MIERPHETDEERAQRLVPLSVELRERLTIYARLLVKWQKTINLVAASTLDEIWTRHFADSAQIVDLAPGAKRWADLGSGAGFPGLVVALQLIGVEEAHVFLIESDQRKAAFLREVSHETGAPAEVVNARIETAVHKLGDVDAVTARALAPLPKLLELAEPLLIKGAKGFFLKGQDVEDELTESSKSSRFSLSLLPSRTNSRARIILAQSQISAGQ